jgi:hypothetical protein
MPPYNGAMRIPELGLPGGTIRKPAPVPRQPLFGLGQYKPGANPWVYQVGPVSVLDKNKQPVPGAKAEIYIGQGDQYSNLYKAYDVSGGQFPATLVPAPPNSSILVYFDAPNLETVTRTDLVANVSQGKGFPTMTALFQVPPAYLLATGETAPSDSLLPFLTAPGTTQQYLWIGAGVLVIGGLAWWLAKRNKRSSGLGDWAPWRLEERDPDEAHSRRGREVEKIFRQVSNQILERGGSVKVAKQRLFDAVTVLQTMRLSPRNDIERHDVNRLRTRVKNLTQLIRDEEANPR